jgi:hypothetical protein
MARKSRADDGDSFDEDEERVVKASDDDDEETLGLDEAEEEEEDDDDEDEDEEFVKDSVATIESRRLFQHEAEDILEALTLDDVQEVLKDNSLETIHAVRLKKILVDVVEKGELDNWEDAWQEAIRRLEEEID